MTETRRRTMLLGEAHRRTAFFFELSLLLTLLIFILQPVGNPLVRAATMVLAAAGLLFPKIRSGWALWLALVALTAWRVLSDWPLPDNHAYLLSIWCLAIAIALANDKSGRVLSLNGRLLVGLVFALATIWKLINADYMDGTFFRVAFIMDERFSGFVRIAGGLDMEMLEHNRVFLQHGDGTFFEPPAFTILVHFATWWTLLIEALIAALFLLPLAKRIRELGHVIVMVFCVTTYAVATVAGFGWLVVAMCVAQLSRYQKALSRAYLFVFALILFYKEVPLITTIADNWAPN